MSGTNAKTMTPDVVDGGQGGYRIRRADEVAAEGPEIERLRNENHDLRRRVAGLEACRIERDALRVELDALRIERGLLLADMVTVVNTLSAERDALKKKYEPTCRHVWIKSPSAKLGCEVCVGCSAERAIQP